jgi:hypothetical protein
MTQRIGTVDRDGADSDRVIDFNFVKQKRQQEKKRRTERVFFKNLLSVYALGEKSKLIPIDLIDVSEEGCSFQIAYDSQSQWPNKHVEIPVRFYFISDTYLEVFVKIQNSSPSIENSVRMIRFGCLVEKATTGYPAYQHFVSFLKMYAEHSRKDSQAQFGY